MDAHAEAPAPAKTHGYLPVEDLPPAREQSTIPLEEQTKLKQELIAARDSQAAAAKVQEVPAEPAKP